MDLYLLDFHDEQNFKFHGLEISGGLCQRSGPYASMWLCIFCLVFHNVILKILFIYYGCAIQSTFMQEDHLSLPAFCLSDIKVS